MKLLIVGLGSMGKRRARLSKGIDAAIRIVGVDTADAHRACDVAFGYAEAVELACRCGFDTFWRLTEEGFVPAPLHRALT